MRVKPVFEKEATEETKKIYGDIKSALGATSLPVFFAHLGAFPEYLDYISEPLIANLKEQKFKTLMKKMAEGMIPFINGRLQKSQELGLWIERYRHSPSFYQFQKGVDDIFILNLKLAFIFVALRESVKGWAIAAKKISSQASGQAEKADFWKDDVVFNPGDKNDFEIKWDKSGLIVIEEQNGLMKSQHGTLEKNMLPEYFQLCRIDCANHMKKNMFWAVRVGLEEMILTSLPLFPHLILSPINVLINLTSKYQEFPDLLYLLAEHFPTSGVQRMMFSGYMKI
ncbi:hypothetical protein HY439_00780 [Candidatus Microgenomates bacterium]|nr:hypothetical protein [Candidatus Microgenomates bacterium]